MNTQKPMKAAKYARGSFLVHSFFPTIQGEGLFAGFPALFIRLAGCNLRCPACDTEYTQGAEMRDVPYLMSIAKDLCPPSKLVVITGGEPFRQQLDPLIASLVHEGYWVQIETNGSMAPTFDTSLMATGRVFIMCSPKVGRIHPDLVDHISAYKYVINYPLVDVIDGLPTNVLGLKARVARPPKGHDKPVYVQPMDSKDEDANRQNLQIAIRSAMQHGYTLCLQIHKIINME